MGKIEKEMLALEKKKQRELKEKSKRLDGYSTYYLATETLTKEAAIEILKTKLSTYKKVSEDFLAKWNDTESLAFKKEYVAVYKVGGKATYLWKTKTKSSGVVEHKEERDVELYLSGSPEELKAKEFSTANFVATEKATVLGSLYAEPIKKAKECKKLMLSQAKDIAPAKGVTEIENEKLEVVFVPVLKVVCTFSGVDYTGYVNLHSGGCIAEYLPSEKLVMSVEKTLRRVRLTKSSVFFAAFYILTFAGIATYQTTIEAFQGRDLPYLFGALIVPFLVYVALCGYKKEKMIKSAVESGKRSAGAAVWLLGLLSWVVALGTLAFYIYCTL